MTSAVLSGLAVPIVLAPMAGGPSTPELAISVDRAGGLGFLAGVPAGSVVSRLRAAGSEVWVTVTSPEEAQKAERAGADALVVQGVEAGGHRGIFIDDDSASELSLLAALQLVQEVSDLPLVAAGSIMTGRADGPRHPQPVLLRLQLLGTGGLPRDQPPDRSASLARPFGRRRLSDQPVGRAGSPPRFGSAREITRTIWADARAALAAGAGGCESPPPGAGAGRSGGNGGAGGITESMDVAGLLQEM